MRVRAHGRAVTKEVRGILEVTDHIAHRAKVIPYPFMARRNVPAHFPPNRELCTLFDIRNSSANLCMVVSLTQLQ